MIAENVMYLNYGCYPSGILWDTNMKYPGVRRILQVQKDALKIAHNHMIDLRMRMTIQANKHRRPAEIEVGRKVWVSTKNMRLPKKVSRKLSRKNIGPCTVLKDITAGTTYKVDLPKDLRDRGIHPVFHALLLRPHIPNDDNKFPNQSSEGIITLTE
ncbi:TY3B-TY3B-like protein, partial [Rhizoctonia solani 123E]